ncbi:MAG: glutamate 5-kinase [Wenzhouxiangella sp.]
MTTDRINDWLYGSSGLVVKVGSSLLLDAGGQPRMAWMETLVRRLSDRPGPVVVVSSGAIAIGRGALGLTRRPRVLAEAQAAAAVGQIELAQRWREAWGGQGRVAAQVLLTLGDLDDRARYLNARATLSTLLARRIVPIINENDTVATEEIRFGDNDRLAARVAQLVDASHLLLLSDVDGLYSADPRQSAEAAHIPEVVELTPEIEALAGSTAASGVGTGGMRSKLDAARIAAVGGVTVVLASGQADDPIGELLAGARHTRFQPGRKRQAARKQWLRGLASPKGQLVIDAGALAAVRRGASLLAVGVQNVQGRFQRGDLLVLQSPEGPCGQGLSACDNEELQALLDDPERASRPLVIHRDDLVLD